MKKMSWSSVIALSLCLLSASSASAADDGETLFGAAMDGKADIVRACLDKGAPVNAKDDDGHTLLMYAALFGRSAVVKLLVERGADIKARDKDGETALMYSAAEGDAESVRFLLDRGADIDPKSNKSGLTAFGYAEKKGNNEVVGLLKAAGAKTSFAGERADEIQDALLMNDVNRVRALLDQGGDIETKFVLGWTPLIRASEEGKTDIVRVLIEKGADISAKSENGETALWCAAMAGRADIVRLLLDKGADVNTEDTGGLSALGIAETQKRIMADRGNDEDAKNLEEVIRVLKAAGAK